MTYDALGRAAAVIMHRQQADWGLGCGRRPLPRSFTETLQPRWLRPTAGGRQRALWLLQLWVMVTDLCWELCHRFRARGASLVLCCCPGMSSDANSLAGIGIFCCKPLQTCVAWLFPRCLSGIMRGRRHDATVGRGCRLEAEWYGAEQHARARLGRQGRCPQRLSLLCRGADAGRHGARVHPRATGRLWTLPPSHSNSKKQRVHVRGCSRAGGEWGRGLADAPNPIRVILVLHTGFVHGM